MQRIIQNKYRKSLTKGEKNFSYDVKNRERERNGEKNIFMMMEKLTTASLML